MKGRWFLPISTPLCASALLTLWLASSTAFADDTMSPLNEAAIDQWIRAGAVYGHLAWDPDGSLVFRRGLNNAKRNEWPAFRLVSDKIL